MNLNLLAQAIGQIHTTAQARVGLAINQVLNWRNWLIGAYIVEFEQSGEDRATYGGKVLETLASGFRRDGFTGLSVSNLRNFRQVALAWPLLPIHQTVSGVLGQEIQQTPSGELGSLPESQPLSGLLDNGIRQTPSAESVLPELVHFPSLQGKTPELPWRDGAWTARLFSCLSFSHLLELARVDDPLKRGFYELECIKSGWSVRELKRQRDRMLFERVGLSRDQEAVMALAREGRLVDSPEMILRDPMFWSSQAWRNERFTANRIWKRRFWIIWRPSFWSLDATSASWSARCALPLQIGIIFWTCFSFTANCDAW